MDGETSDNVPFWKTSIIYQAYPRSISDELPDGTGDLVGELIVSILCILLLLLCICLSLFLHCIQFIIVSFSLYVFLFYCWPYASPSCTSNSPPFMFLTPYVNTSPPVSSRPPYPSTNVILLNSFRQHLHIIGVIIYSEVVI